MAKRGDDSTDGTRWFTVLVAVLGAAVGGGGGTWLYLGSGVGPDQLQAIARPDPFTGTQGRTLEARLNTLERRVDKLPPRELELAVSLLRHDLTSQKQDLEEIEQRIKQLEGKH